MHFLMHIDIISMVMSIVYLKGSQIEFVFLSLKVVLILVSSAGSDEMQHHAAFHLGLHYLPKYPFRGFKFKKV